MLLGSHIVIHYILTNFAFYICKYNSPSTFKGIFDLLAVKSNACFSWSGHAHKLDMSILGNVLLRLVHFKLWLPGFMILTVN